MKMCLDNCTNLVEIDGSIGFLDKLRSLSAKGCSKLKILAPYIMLISLGILDLQGCSCLESFPEVLGKMEKIREIYLDNTAIDTLPFSIGNFVGLQLLSLKGWKRLNELPGSICILPKVEVICYEHARLLIFWRKPRWWTSFELKIVSKDKACLLSSPDFIFWCVFYISWHALSIHKSQ